VTRNPIAYDRREVAIERFSAQTGLRSLVVPVFDTMPTDRFAELTLKSVEAVLGGRLTPEDTVVACSTAEVAAMYEDLGFTIAPVEAGEDPPPDRPWHVLLRLAAGDGTWRHLAHPATLDVFDRYRLDEQVRYFYCHNVLGGAVFPARSIDTTLTFALTHEIYSYGERLDAVRRFAQAIYDHTVPGGVWVNSDVCGPDGRDRTVRLRLRDDDGINPDKPRTDLAALEQQEIAGYVESLSTRARLDQFAADFHFPLPFSSTIALADAMEFLEHKDYADNWLSNP